MKRFGALLLLAIVFAGIFAVWWLCWRVDVAIRSPRTSESPPTVVLGAPIVIVDGRRCVIVDSHLPDGALEWRCPVLERPGYDGSYSMGPYDYHGLWTAYHPNGVVSEVGTYRAGVKHGVWRYWDVEGRLRAEELWREGQRINPAEQLNGLESQ